MSELKIHPAAEVFPMLDQDELQALADDIKQNGLLHPIVLDADDLVVDGRNRLAACKIAGVEPEFDRLNGADPIAFILSMNIARRHMNAGQRAVAVAKIYPDAARGGDRRSSSKLELELPVAKGRLSEARTVLHFAPELADQVLAGKLPLNDAYAEARARKAAAETRDEKMERLKKEAPDLADLAGMTLDQALDKLRERKAEAVQLEHLTESAPDLAELVREGRMLIAEANAAANARKEAAEHARDVSTKYLHGIVHAIDPDGWKPEDRAKFLMRDVCIRRWLQEFDQDLTPKLLFDCAAILKHCAEILKEQIS
jgi:ParB-like chromosome segregation protein Spo0J